MAEQYKSLHPIKFYRDYLSHGIRPDGREFNKFRPILLNVGTIDTADGSAIAKIGNTTVLCGVKAELCKPKPESQDQGFLIPNLELSPLCSPQFKSGPPSDQAQVLSQLISDIILNSKCMDLKELCVYPDKLAWCLFVDFECLDFDGSVVDACILSFVGALKTATLPFIDYDPAVDNIHVNLEERRAINVHHIPVSTTFAILDDKFILKDPTVEEENLCTGILTIVFNDNELCCIHKPGGSPLAHKELQHCIKESKERVPLIKNLINTALKDRK
ncbi:exosome complex component RRP43-like [Diorhabda carinulata]|uniref:exosome complex component RRP43-like n=1 Tax=Diorhabda carinulata TaxID=1163345 RepID=UPI0025A06361|nr:exosome complex component RRP43-like [Diorhabda carinulata]